MSDYFMVYWLLAAFALLLGLVAIPLAARGAVARVWHIHAAVAIALVVAQTIVAYDWLYGGLLPWWRVTGYFMAVTCLPVLSAGWSARASARRWPARPRLAAAVAGLGTLMAVGAASVLATTGMLPDLINAVQ